MAHLPQDRGEIVDDLPTERRRQIAPDLPRLDGHAPSLPSATATSSSSASMLSLVCVIGRSLRGPRFVTCRGRSSVRPNRHSTRAQVSGHVDRSIESNRNRLPHSGCVGSITSTSEEGKSASAHRAFCRWAAASHARRPGPLWDARPNGDNLPRLSPAHALCSASATADRACLPRLAGRAQHYHGCCPGSLIGAKTGHFCATLCQEV